MSGDRRDSIPLAEDANGSSEVVSLRGEKNSRSRYVVSSAIALAALIIAFAWFTGTQRLKLDDDEREHAHAVWLIEHDQTPFVAVFECHPPFYWFFAALFATPDDDAVSLLSTLRLNTGLAHLLTFIALLANQMLGRREGERRLWIIALLVAVAPFSNLQYFVELRPDAWATAMLFGGTLTTRARSGALWLRYATGSFLIALSLLWSPKLIVFAAAFAAAHLFSLVRDRRSIFRASLCAFTGAACAAVVALTVLHRHGIDARAVYDMTMRYHQLLARHGSFGSGLLGAVLAQTTLFIAVSAGALSWMWLVFTRRIQQTDFDVATVAFLTIQLLIARFPYKQYYAPWFLLGAGFIPFAVIAASSVSFSVRERALVLGTAVTFAIGSVTVGQIVARDGFDLDRAYFTYVAEHVPSGPVVTPMPLHPVTRVDAMFSWVYSVDPVGRYGTEEIMRDLALPASVHFTLEQYRAELERSRPAFVALDSAGKTMPRVQRQAVDEYVMRHADEYARQASGPLVFFIRRK